VSRAKPLRLPTVFKEKVWGSTNLAPWYPPDDRKIGEVWFEADLPLLVKFVFTSERLSVQVHPGDAFAAEHERSAGKTEMWHILRADAGAQIALGFRERISRERLRESALSGEIEKLLQWVGVQAGDTFFTPAGTVHAIGAGVAVCEIQQYSDITYRLYDYGRPRELHLEKALQVSSTEPFDARPRSLPIDCSYFHTESMTFAEPIDYKPDSHRFHMLIFLSGGGRIGEEPFQQGEAWLIPAGCEPFSIAPEHPVNLLRTWVP
jgi:mannose-6-phosphate isomerase